MDNVVALVGAAAAAAYLGGLYALRRRRGRAPRLRDDDIPVGCAVAAFTADLVAFLATLVLTDKPLWLALVAGVAAILLVGLSLAIHVPPSQTDSEK